MEDLSLALSQQIESTFRIVEVKINYTKEECEAGIELSPPESIYAVISYFDDLKLDIVFATAGIHVNGKSQKPHLHWHLIVRSLPTGTFQTENSKHRKRWLAKEGNEDFSFEGVTFRFPKKMEDPVWQVLSYPYKEGLVCDHKPLQIIPKEFQKFLIDYAQEVYQVSLGLRARNDASEARRQKALNDLGKLCDDNKHMFTTYREMVKWLEINYLKMLPLEEKPTLANYKVNCQKIGNKLGIFDYCDYM